MAASSQPSASALEQEEAGGSFKTSKQIFKSSSSLHQADSIASFEVVDKVGRGCAGERQGSDRGSSEGGGGTGGLSPRDGGS